MATALLWDTGVWDTNTWDTDSTLATLSDNYSAYASGYPTNVTILSIQPTQLKLSWTAPDTAFGVVSGYRVYRAYTIQEEMSPIGYTADTEYIDSGVETGRDYYYRVTSLF